MICSNIIGQKERTNSNIIISQQEHSQLILDCNSTSLFFITGNMKPPCHQRCDFSSTVAHQSYWNAILENALHFNEHSTWSLTLDWGISICYKVVINLIRVIFPVIKKNEFILMERKQFCLTQGACDASNALHQRNLFTT